MDIKPIGISNRNALSKTKKTAGRGQLAFGGMMSASDDTMDTVAAQGSSAAFAIDPLFMDLQSPSKRDTAIAAGLDLLEALDRLRLTLLSGDSMEAKTTLLRIKEGVQSIPTDEMDEELKEILLEVETRAVVELAKASVKAR